MFAQYDFTLEYQAIKEFEQYEKEKEERKQNEEEVKIRREKRRKEEEEAVAAKAEAAAAKAAALVREYEEEIAKQTKGGRDLGTAGSVVISPPISQTEVLESPESDSSVRTGSTSLYPESNVVLTGVQVEPNEAVVIPSDSSTPSETCVTYPAVAEVAVIQDSDTNIIGTTVNTYNSGGESVAYVHPGDMRNSYSLNSVPQPTPTPCYQEPLRPYESSKYVPQARLPLMSINLSDFESDTANPFDNVELKSINDMAVLATVLQNNCTVPTSNNRNNHNNDRGSTAGNNVNMNLNGMVNHQAGGGGVTYYPYLSHNSNNPMPYPHHQQPQPHLGWTPTSQNPFYSHFTPTMVTVSSAITAPTALGPSASSDSSFPLRQQTTTATTTAPVSTHSVPMHRPSTQLDQQAGISSSPQTAPTTLQSAPNPTPENFANFYFPFTSGQAQSRLKNPSDREFS